MEKHNTLLRKSDKAEEKWEKAFANSEDVLNKLADEAIKEHRQGKTRPLMIKLN